MKKIFLAFLLITACVVNSHASTAVLLVGQSYQEEISGVGYHYITIESATSTNPSVEVKSMGLVVKATVKAYFHGESTITIRMRYQLYPTQNYQYRTKTFTISCNDTYISLPSNTVYLKVGESETIGYSFNRPTYVTPSIQWTSSDEDIVKVSNTGVVTGVGEGTATIYARSNLGSNNASLMVTVQDSNNDNGNNNSGNEEGSFMYDPNATEFHIKTKEELLGFRALVNNGISFNNQTVYLDSNLDLSAITWDTPIGKDEEYAFSGIFNGQGHYININMNFEDIGEFENFLNLGLFGYSTGVISNLEIKGNIEASVNYAYFGSIVGYNYDGTIEHCVNSANINIDNKTSVSKHNYWGGIVGINDKGNVKFCVNRGNINTESFAYDLHSSNYFYYIGGIVAYSSSTSGIYASRNYGNLTINSSDHNMNIKSQIYNYVGGIVGTARNISCMYCANFGNIEVEKCNNYNFIGGITSASHNVSNSFVACKTIGFMEGGTASNVGGIGVDCYLYDCYTARDIKFKPGTTHECGSRVYTIDEMKTAEFADLLNANNKSKEYIWVGKDGAFPIIAGSPDSEDYYYPTVSDVACESAILYSNAELFVDDIHYCGFLIKKDDGEESYISYNKGSKGIKIDNLEPSRNYEVRWYAKDGKGKEYYSNTIKFTTKSIEPTTIAPKTIGTRNAIVEGICDYSKIIKQGFLIAEDKENGQEKYFWADKLEGNVFSSYVTGLSGNTKYRLYSVIMDLDSIYHYGNEIVFKTISIETLPPSDYTEISVMLNGVLGVDAEKAFFEYRMDSWPSVIASKTIDTDACCGDKTVLFDNLTNGEKYKYRLVADVDGQQIYGDWIEFIFETTTNINLTYSENLSVYTIGNNLIVKGTKNYDVYSIGGEYLGSPTYISNGIYIVVAKGRKHKIFVK